MHSQVSVSLDEKVETLMYITLNGIAGYESLKDCQMLDVTVHEYVTLWLWPLSLARMMNEKICYVRILTQKCDNGNGSFYFL